MSNFTDAKTPKLETIDLIRLSGDIWDEVQRFDDRIRQFHHGLQAPGINYFQEAIRLLAEMFQAIAKPSRGWQPKFPVGSKLAMAIAMSAAGSFRSLLASYKLLMDGYFMEAQMTTRMVEQWAEVSVIVEANPGLAEKVLAQGVKGQYLQIARRKSADIDKLLKEMGKTFSNLSKRGHVTATAINFVAPSKSDKLLELSIAGNGNAEMLRKDSLVLAGIAMNVIKVLGRHFKTVQSSWKSKFDLTEKLITDSIILPQYQKK